MLIHTQQVGTQGIAPSMYAFLIYGYKQGFVQCKVNVIEMAREFRILALNAEGLRN